MNPFIWIKKQSIFQDRQCVWLVILSFLLMVWDVIYALASIESRDHKVFVRYSGYFEGTLSDRGEWYSLYVLPAFAVVVFAINMVLAFKLHKMRPELTKTILMINLLVGLYIFLVSRALIDLI